MKGLDDEEAIAKLQVGFINYVILPLWKAVAILFPKASLQEENCQTNAKLWQQIVDKKAPTPLKSPSYGASDKSVSLTDVSATLNDSVIEESDETDEAAGLSVNTSSFD
jgi:hypothetical protein